MTAVQESPTGTVTVRPVAGHIGADISGVDISQPLSEQTVRDLKDALHRYKVIFFRDQDITQAQHVAFGRYFGEVTPAHPTLPAVFDDYPEILLLDNQLGYPRTSARTVQ